jgi:2-keto-4-pentenoate hydratase
MSTDANLDTAAEANRIIGARERGALLDPITDRIPLNMDQAYAIQARVVSSWYARDERRVGWKLGYTSAAMRRQMNVDAPNFGPLTDAMWLADGADVGSRFSQPKVEPEVLLRFAADVPDDADRAAVLAAAAGAHAALEVVDSVWRDYRFRIEDNTADGSSAAAFVVGPEIALDAIDVVPVELLLDGTAAASGVGSDASGHPADGVVWLIAQLAARGEQVRAGDVVLTGGLTAAVGLAAGSEVSARFGDTTTVTVRRRR